MIEIMFNPIPLFPVPFHGAIFWLSGSFDNTTIIRLIVSPLLTWLSLKLSKDNPRFVWIYPLFELGIFCSNGTASRECINICNHGANVVDLLAALWAPVLYVIINKFIKKGVL